jgi:hypothetical protein
MKILKLYTALIIMLMIGYTNNIIAKPISKNDVQANVIATFTAKYPKAEVKGWQLANDEYTAKAKENGRKFFATFDKNGQWIKTTIQISWSRNLPADVRAALKESKYAAWRVDKIKKIETPDGEFYQVLVDNVDQQIDADHMGFAENYVLNFKPGGEIFAEQSISSPLLF